MKPATRMAAAAVAGIALAAAETSHAAEISFEPSISSRINYQTNPRLLLDGRRSTFGVALSPTARLRRRTENGDWELRSSLTQRQYSSDKLLTAIKTIVVADVVMSLDNVIAIAAAAKNAGQSHELVLVILGLLISVPIIVGGSQLVMKLMERFPIIIVLGGMLLGWIAGGMFVTDPVFTHPEQWLWAPKLGTLNADGLAEVHGALYYGSHLAGALLVLATGKWLVARSKKEG